MNVIINEGIVGNRRGTYGGLARGVYIYKKKK